MNEQNNNIMMGIQPGISKASFMSASDEDLSGAKQMGLIEYVLSEDPPPSSLKDLPNATLQMGSMGIQPGTNKTPFMPGSDEDLPDATVQMHNMSIATPAVDTERCMLSEEHMPQPQTTKFCADLGTGVKLPHLIDSFPHDDYEMETSPEIVTESFDFSGGPNPPPTSFAIPPKVVIQSTTSSSENSPQIHLEIPDHMRFRYGSEIKPQKSDRDSSSAKGRLGSMTLLNVYGAVEVHMIAVADPSGGVHRNKLQLTSKKECYSQAEDVVILKSYQKKSQMTYELPHMNIIRATKDSNKSASSVDCSRIRIMFKVFVDGALVAQKISDEILDTKCHKSSDTILTKVNPREAQLWSQVDVILLGENITAKHKVCFYDKKSREQICDPVVPFLFYKNCTAIVKTPLLQSKFGDQSANLVCEIVLSSDECGESNGIDFTFIVPRAEKRRLKDECGAGVPKDKLRHHIMSKKLPSKLQTDERDEEEPKSDDEIYQIAFHVAQGKIQFDELLCQDLSLSPRAMLKKNDNDHTPLAFAITSGALNVAEAFLSRMPPPLADQLLKQKLTKMHVTHLLLMASWPDGEPPLPLLTTLLKAGSDLEALDTEGNSLLHLLIRNEKHGALESILSSKDQEPFSKITTMLDQINTAGFAPLHEAVSRRQPHAVKALLSAGANVNIASRNSKPMQASESSLQRPVKKMRLALAGLSLETSEWILLKKTATDIANDGDNPRISGEGEQNSSDIALAQRGGVAVFLEESLER